MLSSSSSPTLSSNKVTATQHQQIFASAHDPCCSAVALGRQGPVESTAAVHVLTRLSLGDSTHAADVGVGHVLPLGGVEPDGDAHHLHHLQLLRIHVPVAQRRSSRVPSALEWRGRIGGLLVLLVVVVGGGGGRLAAALVAAGVGRGRRAATMRVGVAAVGSVPVRRWGSGPGALPFTVAAAVAQISSKEAHERTRG